MKTPIADCSYYAGGIALLEPVANSPGLGHLKVGVLYSGQEPTEFLFFAIRRSRLQIYSNDV